MTQRSLPLLPLVLDRTPSALHLALAQEGIPVVDRATQPRAGRFLLWDSRRGRLDGVAPGQTPIDVDLLRRGQPVDPFEALTDERPSRAGWWMAGFDLTEEVARVDKATVRRRMLAALARRVQTEGGVWLRLAAYPFPYRSAFNFRIDHDDFHRRDFDVALRAFAGFEHATTHFVCAGGFVGRADASQRLRGLDVGSHGFHHHTYRDIDQNRTNIGRGIEFLHNCGFEPTGFAAPHGRFNRGLAAALEELGVSYSSEFGLAYDELPFWPAGSSVLQVPIHPICLGLFLESAARRAPGDREVAARAAQACAEHFRQTVREKFDAGQPVFLYGHPTGRLGCYPRVVQAALAEIEPLGGLWKVSLSEFAAWWRARQDVRMTVEESEGRLIVIIENAPPRMRLAAEFLRGGHIARIALTGPRVEFAAGSLAFEGRRAPREPLLRVDRPHGLRRRLLDYLDWERVTPLDELPHDTMRRRLKRWLRRIRS